MSIKLDTNGQTVPYHPYHDGGRFTEEKLLESLRNWTYTAIHVRVPSHLGENCSVAYVNLLDGIKRYCHQYWRYASSDDTYDWRLLGQFRNIPCVKSSIGTLLWAYNKYQCHFTSNSFIGQLYELGVKLFHFPFWHFPPADPNSCQLVIVPAFRQNTGQIWRDERSNNVTTWNKTKLKPNVRPLIMLIYIFTDHFLSPTISFN